MRIFNTLSGKKEIFEPIEDNKIRMYVCGMTVYDDTHIGHARTFLSFDLIVRYLRSIDYEVQYIRNITDVDDKIIARAEELNISPSELTLDCINSMHNDFQALGMISPDAEPRATENIDSIISLITKLIDKGHAYVSESDVYFSTESFDIHGGGSDLKFPHHENEIAQSECVTGKEFAKVWMHTGSLRIDDQKMSKSLKNFITIKEALNENASEVLRFFLISSHYRSPLNYSDEGLKEAKNSLDRLYNSLQELSYETDEHIPTDYSGKFHDAMQDDFNSPLAISVLFEIVKEINILKKEDKLTEASILASELVSLSNILGILLDDPENYFTSGIDLSNQDIEAAIEIRNKARKDRDFELSDKIRDDLLKKGITLEDKG